MVLQRLSLIERSQSGAGVVSQSRSAGIGRGAGCDRRDVYAGRERFSGLPTGAGVVSQSRSPRAACCKRIWASCLHLVAASRKATDRLSHGIEKQQNRILRKRNISGVAYSTGRGVPENSRNALKWYLKAAEQGFAPAQSALGKFMLMGAGVCLKIISRPIFGITWQVYIRKNLRMIVQRSLPKETDSRERSPQINLARHMPPLISSGEKSTNQRRRKRLPEEVLIR